MRVESYDLQIDIFLANLKKPKFILLKKFSTLNSQLSTLNSQLSTLVLATLLPTLLFAQPSYEFDVHYGFGASEFSYNSVPGFAISVYPFGNFGFSTGFEYSWRWQIKTSSIAESNPITVDSEGDSVIFKYSIDKYRERLYGKILQIPMLFKYNDDSYYAAAGAKIGIPLDFRANVSYRGLKTEGYYPKYNGTLYDPLFQGFGKQEDGSARIKISDLKNSFMLALEGGVKLKLNNNFSLLTGVFADFSLNKSFDRKLPPIIERIENEDSDDVKLITNDTRKSWRPWSVGIVVKISFLHKLKPAELSTLNSQLSTQADTNQSITVKADNLPPPPIPIYDPQYQAQPAADSAEQGNEFQVPPLPEFLLNRKADFVFHYPETRTSPSDSLHLDLISQIADTLRTMPGSQLHCVGYSEKLLSESLAYETALQRSLRIRYTLSRFYGIEESSIFIYSQGSRNSGYRRAECFVFDRQP